MADFDPDAYLASKEKPAPAAGFDPDAYLATKAGTAAPAAKPESTWFDSVKDAVKSAPGSFARASAGLLGLGQTVADTFSSRDDVQRYVDAQLKKEGKAPEPKVDLGKTSLEGLKMVMGPTYHDPETKTGKVADFALQNVLFGAKKPKDLLNGAQTLKSLISGVAGGTAGELVPDDYPKIKAAAQIVGGFSPSLIEVALKSPDRATKNAAKMLKQSMAGKTDAEWKQAEELFQQAKKVGVPLAGPEAFPGGSQVQQLASDIAASPAAGAKVREFTQQRPGQVQASVAQHLRNVGKDVGGQEAANQMEAAGTKVVQSAEVGRSRAVSAFYRAAANDKVPEEAMTGILGKIDAAIAADKTGLLAQKLQDFKGTLLEKSSGPTSGSASLKDQILGVKSEPKPITDIENLDRARKYFRDKIELPAMSADAMPKEVSKAIGPFLDQIRKEMEGTSENYQRGKALYQTISEKRVDPLMKGPVGKVAGKGADAQREASYVRVMSELGSDIATPERIRSLAKEVSKVDKEAFPNVTRAYLEAKLNTSLKDLQGRRNPMAGANFRNAIAGTPKDQANLRAMIEETAAIQKQPPDKVYKGFQNLLDVLDATGRVPGMGSQTQSRMENAAMARANPTSGVIEAVSTKPTHRIGKWLDDMMYRKTYSKLAEVFTSPESVKEMKKLADMKPTSPEARQLVSVMLTSAATGANDHDDSK